MEGTGSGADRRGDLPSRKRRRISPGIREISRTIERIPDTRGRKIWMNVRGTLCDTLVDGYGLRDVVLFKNCSIYPLFREFVQLCEKKEGSKTELARRTSLLFHEILLNLAAHEAAGGSQEKPLPETAVHIKKNMWTSIFMKS